MMGELTLAPRSVKGEFRAFPQIKADFAPCIHITVYGTVEKVKSIISDLMSDSVMTFLLGTQPGLFIAMAGLASCCVSHKLVE
jgi:hypothetical protein